MHALALGLWCGGFGASGLRGFFSSSRELRNALLAGLRLAEGREAGAAEPARHAGVRP